MKRYILTSLILAFLAVVVILLTRNQEKELRPAVPAQAQAIAPIVTEVESASPIHTNQNDPAPELSKLETTESLWKKVSLEDPRDLVAEARFRENLPYEHRGGGGIGWVIDREGNVLMESGIEIAIFDTKASPEKQRILVNGEGSGSLVLKPSTNEKIKLPKFPPGENMLGLGWYWIDETNLLGLAGTIALDEKGKPVTHDNNVGKSKLYIFNLQRRDLSELPLPPDVNEPVIEIPEVGLGGYFRLVEHSANGANEKDLGWFKIALPK